MAQASLSVRVDGDIKAKFDKFCSEVGMNASVAINLFIKAVLRENRIPFEITTNVSDPFYSEVNQERLIEAISRLESGKGTVHEIIEEDE